MRAYCRFQTYWGRVVPDSGKIIGLFQHALKRGVEKEA